jgi:hypothetical protein
MSPGAFSAGWAANPTPTSRDAEGALLVACERQPALLTAPSRNSHVKELM